MVALAVVLSAVVVLLAVLVPGLLRSHADILKSLHDLGVGVGEPGGDLAGGRADDHRRSPAGNRQVPITLGPPLPGERSATSAPAVSGVTTTGDALAVTTDGDHLTLLAFLSSGCTTCAGFWSALQDHRNLGLPGHTRLVVVTKGPDLEIPAEVAARAPVDLPVVMSTGAWGDYEVPGSPFFVLVDGRSGRRIGEGVANHVHQVVELVRTGALVEVMVGGVGLALPRPVSALAVAASYAAFAAFVLVVRVRGGALASWGCFGTPDTPATSLHVVVDVALAVAAVVVALSGQGATIASVLADQPAHGIPLVVVSALGTWLTYLALSVLADLQGARRLTGVTFGRPG